MFLFALFPFGTLKRNQIPVASLFGDESDSDFD
jgi:hypothetical protein